MGNLLETHHHQILRNPAVRREVLQHGDQELETAIPVAQQQHHTDQVHYPHHGTGKVIGHMEDLKRGKGKNSNTDMYARGKKKRKKRMRIIFQNC